MSGTLIIADDLSGAADCASAWLMAGQSPLALIDATADCGDAPVIAVDVDSRALAREESGAAVSAAVERFLREDTRILYQKMDSTLRGHWAHEAACVLQAVATIRRSQPLAIVAPAFPAAGRTMIGGRVLLHGVPLEETETWSHQGASRFSDPGASLGGEGLRVAGASLDQVRSGPQALGAFFAGCQAAGAEVVLCDASSEADLDAIAGAALAAARMPLCVGSSGLMRSLVRQSARSCAPAPSPSAVATAGPVLAVVGSASRVSHDQVRAMIEERGIASIKVAPSALRRGAFPATLHTLTERIDAVLASGDDLAIVVDGSEGVDLKEGPHCTAALADLVAPRLNRLGGLILTGGETARAVLTRSGVAGLRIRHEVEPGVPLSSALGAVGIPVVTKAGAFGDRQTLIRCLDAIRGSCS